MKKLFGLRILSKEEYLSLVETERNWEEREAIIRDNAIQKEKEKLEKKYKKHFGKWYEDEEGYVFQIMGVRYNPHSYGIYDNFDFECYFPNQEDWMDVHISDITENQYTELAEKQVAGRLGLKKGDSN